MNVKNIPNILTFLRFFLALLIMVFLRSDERIHYEIACFIVILAGATDYLDGVFARRYHVVSSLGKFLDPLADKIFVLTALIMLVWLHRIAPEIAILLIAREVLVTGVRAIAVTQGLVIAAGRGGKIKTVFQMIGVGALILDDIYFGLDTHIVGIFCIGLSLYFSIISAIEYIAQVTFLKTSGRA